MTPDKLPEEIQEQIDDESNQRLARQKELAESECDLAYAQGEAEGYATGATAWAGWKVKYDELKSLFDEVKNSERLVSKAYAQALIDRDELKSVLQEFVSNHEAGLLPNKFVYEKAIKILNDGK